MKIKRPSNVSIFIIAKINLLIFNIRSKTVEHTMIDSVAVMLEAEKNKKNQSSKSKGENTMATQMEVSKTNQGIHPPLVNKVSLGFVGLIIILALFIVITANVFSISNARIVSNDQRSLDAWAARYQALADRTRPISEKALEAWGGRYQALADYEANRSQRALDAWKKWYQELAKYEAWKAQKALNAWGARYQGLADSEATNSQKALDAWGARYQGLAESEVIRSQRVLEAWAARYQGMAEYYLSKK
jgi:hemoglobin-like flavoprotein